MYSDAINTHIIYGTLGGCVENISLKIVQLSPMWEFKFVLDYSQGVSMTATAYGHEPTIFSISTILF